MGLFEVNEIAAHPLGLKTLRFLFFLMSSENKNAFKARFEQGHITCNLRLLFEENASNQNC